MPAITASMVNELRARTGQAMMECKRVLVETEGDIEKAIAVFRKRGVKDSIASRAATEGRVFVKTAGNVGAIAEVLCNTDFTAKSDVVKHVLDTVVDKLLSGASVTDDAELKTLLTDASQKTGENVTLGRTKVLKGEKVGSYYYSVTGKIAVLVAVKGQASDELLSDIALHITAYKPVALGMGREHVPADLVAKERELAVEAAKATGKPQNIAEKIAEGKLNAFFAERVLGEQEFINAEKFKGSINDILKKAGVTLTEFVRMEVGIE